MNNGCLIFKLEHLSPFKHVLHCVKCLWCFSAVNEVTTMSSVSFPHFNFSFTNKKLVNSNICSRAPQTAYFKVFLEINIDLQFPM